MKASGLLLFLLLFLLARCEYDAAIVEPVPDYTGQTGNVTDIDGNIYKTTGIGTQIWMAENLKTSRLKDSTSLPYISDNIEWKSQSSPAYCWYENDSIYLKRYGALYNYHAVKTGLLCPEGWRVPDEDDLNIMISYLGGAKVAGGKLKSYSPNAWDSPNYCFDNNYNFAALPGGYRQRYTGQFLHKGHHGEWWCFTAENEFRGISYNMASSRTSLSLESGSNKDGFSVRCIKDIPKR